MTSERQPLISNGTTIPTYMKLGGNEHRTITYCIHGADLQLCCEMTCQDKNGQNSVSKKIEIPHCHTFDTERSKIDSAARKRLIIASVLCLMFMVVEIVGGILANSLAIASDAAHLLTDFASFMISLFSIWMASRPATRQMSFGWHRAEVIGALTSVLMIWVVTGILCYVATERIMYQNFEVEGGIMLITASIGVVVNIIMGLSLTFGGLPHGHTHGGGSSSGHSHSAHAHSHSAELGDTHEDHDHGKEFSADAHQGRGNINVRAAFIHVLGDFFQSVGVLIASLIIYFFPEYHIIDPICTFVFSVIVLITTLHIIRDVLNVLMEGIPKGIDIQEVQKTLFNITGVRKVHNLRIWSLSLDKAALSTHLAVEKGYEPSRILNDALREVKARYDIYELTIQIEEYLDEMQDCEQCQQ